MPGINEDDSIRDTLHSVISETSAPAPAAETPSPAPAPAVVDTPAAAPAAPGAAPVTPPATPGAPPAAEGVKDPAVEDVKQNIGTVVAQKPPGTWSPQAREHWNTVPPEVRQEIWKREKEVSRAMTQSATARAFHKEFEQTMQPYMGFIAAENSNPLKAVNYMMQGAAILRVGSAEQKADLITGLINQWGIDLGLLDAKLAGVQPPPGPQGFDPNQIARIVQQQLAPIQQQYQTQQQQLLQQIEAEVDDELGNFAAAHEFYDDVKDDMADIIEVAQRRGVNISLTEAYERATLLSAPVRAVMEQRKATNAAQQSHQIAQQAKSGAFSVKDSAATGVTGAPAGDSIRDAIQFAMQHHSGRN